MNSSEGLNEEVIEDEEPLEHYQLLGMVIIRHEAYRFDKFLPLLYHNKVSRLAIFRWQANLKMKKMMKTKKKMKNLTKKWMLTDDHRQWIR